MKALLFDLSFVAGVGSITYAASIVHPAMGWLVVGVALAAFGVFGAARKKEKDH